MKNYLYLSLVFFFGCSMTDQEPLAGIDRRVDLNRFMGDWYVVASIPIDLWFVSEANAYNGIETYELTDDGRILTTYTFNDGSFSGEVVQFNPVAWVDNLETNAEWKMQFMWPFRSTYLIAYLDENYQETIIGVPSRKYVWIMTRTANIGEANLERLIGIARDLGHDTDRIRIIPHESQ